jgi:hypothetical protein
MLSLKMVVSVPMGVRRRATMRAIISALYESVARPWLPKQVPGMNGSSSGMVSHVKKLLMGMGVQRFRAGRNRPSMMTAARPVHQSPAASLRCDPSV